MKIKVIFFTFFILFSGIILPINISYSTNFFDLLPGFDSEDDYYDDSDSSGIFNITGSASLKGYKLSSKNKKFLKKHGHRKLNNIERRLITKGKEGVIAGRDVIYNDRIFKNETKDAFGVNNCSRMLSGRAPIGKDGLEVSLHHLQQKNDGIIIETATSYHRDHYSKLHKYNTQSEINRSNFDYWRKLYWRERGAMRCN